MMHVDSVQTGARNGLIRGRDPNWQYSLAAAQRFRPTGSLPSSNDRAYRNVIRTVCQAFTRGAREKNET